MYAWNFGLKVGNWRIGVFCTIRSSRFWTAGIRIQFCHSWKLCPVKYCCVLGAAYTFQTHSITHAGIHFWQLQCVFDKACTKYCALTNTAMGSTNRASDFIFIVCEGLWVFPMWFVSHSRGYLYLSSEHVNPISQLFGCLVFYQCTPYAYRIALQPQLPLLQTCAWTNSRPNAVVHVHV